MSCSGESDNYKVCFVRCQRESEITENLRLAFESMKRHDLDPVWITEEMCYETDKKAKLFVMDPFEGDVFTHLKHLHCRIVGPLCILSCLQLGERLPKRPHPVYSVSMRKITVTCSNLDKKTREDICNKVQLLGGTFSRDFTKSVTHLIAGEVGSQKYHVAAKFGLPIMLPSWVDEVWNHGQFQQIHASDSIYNKHFCPVFMGLSISVSQLSTEDRLAVKKLVESNGGRYSGAMKCRDTTHLVLLEPKGDKYDFAVSWKLHCVRRDWLFDSVNAGYCVDEKSYQLCSIDIGPKRSTPVKDRADAKLIVDCSAIHASFASHLSETAQSEISIMAKQKLQSSLDLLDAFDVSSLSKNGQFLDGCKIFLAGFKASHLEKLHKIVNAGGGIRFGKFSESISHVVCGGSGDSHFMDQLRVVSSKPHIVNFKWLLECCKQQKLIDESAFLCGEFSALSPQKIESSEAAVVAPGRSNSALLSKDVTLPSDITEIFQQYAGEHCIHKKSAPESEFIHSKSTSSDRSKLGLEAAPVECGTVTDELKYQLVPHEDKESNAESRKNFISEMEPPVLSTQSGMFLGMAFVIVGFDEKDTEVFTNAITLNAGNVFSGSVDRRADVAIVPLIWKKVNVNADAVSTNCWLEKCIEEQSILPIGSNELFSPFYVSSQPLKNTVISISQYSGVERDGLMHLASVLGAHCQEYFVRRANPARRLLPNTHLIASSPEGSKYEASKKWKIPAVTKYWLFASASSEAVPDVKDYLVGPTDSSKMNSISKTSLIASKSDNVFEENNCRVGKDLDCPIGTVVTKKSESEEVVLQNARVRELIDADKLFTPKQYSVCSSAAPSTLLYKPHFDVSGMIQDLDSSQSLSVDGSGKKQDRRNLSMPLEEAVNHNFGLALKLFGHSSENKCNGNSETTVESNVECKTYGPVLNDNVLPPVEKTVPCKAILNGVIACFSKKLGNVRTDLGKIVVSLGGEYRWIYDNTCTHYVFQGKLNDLNREFREAKRNGKKIVAPEWIYACRDTNSLVAEHAYPHTFKPRLSLLEISTSKENPHTNCTESDTDTFIPPDPISERVQMAGDDDGEISLDVGKQLDELIVAAKSAKAGKRRTRRNATVSSESSTDRSNLKVSGTSPHFQHAYSSTDIRSKFQHIDGASSEPSQGVPITWDDPTGRLEREKIAANLTSEGKQDHSHEADISSQSDDRIGDGDPCLPTARFLVSKKCEGLPEPSKKFMFTSLLEDERLRYSSLVSELGGTVSDSKTFDDMATHLILGQPIKNEKFLACVASGRWVLHKSYLEDSAKNNKFLPEENYEWGSDATKSFISKNSASALKMSLCPRRWRIKLRSEADHKGAFHDWKVVVITDKQKASSYVKILKAGGAQVFLLSAVNSNMSVLTHAFIEVSKNSEMSFDLELFVKHKVKCLKPEYLAYYLIEDPPPSENDYLYPEVRSVLSTSTSVSKRQRHTPHDTDRKRSRVMQSDE